jgi:hypothetical protein
MEPIKNLIPLLPDSSYIHGRKKTTAVGERKTERGNLFDTILFRLNPDRVKKSIKPLTHSRLGYLLTNVPTKDLYALISRCDDAERRGYPWGAIFWKEVRPQS